MARKKGYSQFCPIAKASEVLAERWNFLVVRELVGGSTRFSELRRGLPAMSPTLLSRRLRELEAAGIVSRRPRAGSGSEYSLTDAGRELAPVLEQLGMWGKRWAQRHVQRQDLDVGLLMWFAHRHVDVSKLPARRVVVRFEFPRTREKQKWYWLVVEDGEVDLCLVNPGYDTDVIVESDLRTMTDVYLGYITPQAAVRSGKVVLEGKSALARSFGSWCPRSDFASIPAART